MICSFRAFSRGSFRREQASDTRWSQIHLSQAGVANGSIVCDIHELLSFSLTLVEVVSNLPNFCLAQNNGLCWLGCKERSWQPPSPLALTCVCNSQSATAVFCFFPRSLSLVDINTTKKKPRSSTMCVYRSMVGDLKNNIYIHAEAESETMSCAANGKSIIKNSLIKFKQPSSVRERARERERSSTKNVEIIAIVSSLSFVLNLIIIMLELCYRVFDGNFYTFSRSLVFSLFGIVVIHRALSNNTKNQKATSHMISGGFSVCRPFLGFQSGLCVAFTIYAETCTSEREREKCVFPVKRD